MNGIIYKAVNKLDGKSYVGLTTNTLKARKTRHEYDARNIDTTNVFHRALIKYGLQAFEWSIIETFDTLSIGIKKEQEWMKTLQTLVPDGYNMILGYNRNSINRVETDLSKAIAGLEASGFHFFLPKQNEQGTMQLRNGVLSYRVPCDTDCEESGYIWIDEGTYDNYGKLIAVELN